MSLRLGLLNFCDVFSPTIQPGVQLDIKNRFAVGVDCGIGILSLLEEDSSNNKYGNHHYYKLKAEGKYFFKQKEKQNLAKRIFPYISIEHMYFHHTYSPKNQYVEVKKSKKYYYFSSANIERNIHVATGKFGFEYYFNKRLFLDTYVGLGVRQYYVALHNPQDLRQSIEPTYPADYIRLYSRFTIGDFTLANVMLGIKLGFLLN
ncbi:MAG: hypothetical protein KA974_04905 [Saprospiraceae bacterium]|nr:hypothetical protein [Saprospiraceae bacterium]